MKHTRIAILLFFCALCLAGCGKEESCICGPDQVVAPTYLDLLPRYMDQIKGGWHREYQQAYRDSTSTYRYQPTDITSYFFEGGRYAEDWHFGAFELSEAGFVNRWGWYYFDRDGVLWLGITHTTDQTWETTLDHPWRWDEVEIVTWENSGYPDVLVLKREYIANQYMIIDWDLMKYERVKRGNEIVWVEYSVEKPVGQRSYRTGCPTLEEFRASLKR